MSFSAENTLIKLQRLLALIESAPNSFYAKRLAGAGEQRASTETIKFSLSPKPEPAGQIKSIAEFVSRVPFTTKDDLLQDRLKHPPFGSNFTDRLELYTRFCQTSGTSSGLPMAVLDTRESWSAMLDCWREVYQAAGLKSGRDRIFFAFSFGPFLGFWTAFEAAASDYLALPGGGLTSQSRLEMVARYGATVLCCTPTYALRLGETIGAVSGIGHDQLRVRKIIVAGEPGGSLPTTRQKLRQLWGKVEIFDHHGMTEVGPVSYEDPANEGSLCVIEDAYFAEVIGHDGKEVSDGAEGELVLTTLNRTASPLLRYRTGDWVCKHRHDGRLYLDGGILSRCDEMVVIRGVNIYPSAVENIVRCFPEVVEFMVEQKRVDNMEEIELKAELIPELEESQRMSVVRALEDRLRDNFALRIPVIAVDHGLLPRHEFKSRRWRRV
jgi:phenylacetate-CoA ligase